MKRTILYLAAAAVIALGFTSCNKDEKTEEGMQFRATMENNDAKTALVGTHVNWVEGDEVMIYGTEQNGLYRATPDVEDARSATLTKVGQPVISKGPVFRAIYPAASAVSATSFTIPAVQESVDGSLVFLPGAIFCGYASALVEIAQVPDIVDAVADVVDTGRALVGGRHPNRGEALICQTWS